MAPSWSCAYQVIATLDHLHARCRKENNAKQRTRIRGSEAVRCMALSQLFLKQHSILRSAISTSS